MPVAVQEQGSLLNMRVLSGGKKGALASIAATHALEQPLSWMPRGLAGSHECPPEGVAAPQVAAPRHKVLVHKRRKAGVAERAAAEGVRVLHVIGSQKCKAVRLL